MSWSEDFGGPLLVWALIFISWVGIGPFAGVLALWVHSVAALVKLYSEQIESIEPGPVEAIRATGASGVQMLRFGVVPQVIPPFLSFTMYRWDINVRMATILGFVGAGGLLAAVINGGAAVALESDLAVRCPNRDCPPEAHGDADLSDATIDISTDLTGALYDATTTWPNGTDPVVIGARQLTPGSDLTGVDLSGTRLQGSDETLLDLRATRLDGRAGASPHGGEDRR